MATSTHKLAIGSAEWTNVSNGNLNCSLAVAKDQSIQLAVTGEMPLPDTEDYIPITGPGFQDERDWVVIGVENLAAEDDVWVKAASSHGHVYVIRGPAVLR